MQRYLLYSLSRGHEVISGEGVVSTKETIHGLLRLEENHLAIQWRLAKTTDRVGDEIRSDREVEAVREVPIPSKDPAELVVRLRRADRIAADEFAAELALAVAEGALKAARSNRSIGPGAPDPDQR